MRTEWLALAVVFVTAPVFAQSLIDSAEQLQAQGEHASARVVLEQIPADQRDARVLQRLAETELALDLHDEAAAHLREALARTDDPWLVDHLAEIARLLARASEPPVAVREYDWTASRPSAPDAHPATTMTAEPAAEPVTLPSTLLEQFAPTESETSTAEPWVYSGRFQPFLGFGLWNPSDSWGDDPDLLFAVGAELVIPLAGVVSLRTQLRFGVTMLNGSEERRFPAGFAAVDESRELVLDATVGVRAYPHPRVLIGGGIRGGMRRVAWRDARVLQAFEGYNTAPMTIEQDIIAYRGIGQGVIEIGGRTGPDERIELRGEISLGKPVVSIMLIFAAQVVGL